MMKFKSTILAVMIAGYCCPTMSMQNPPAEPIAQATAAAQAAQKQRGWFESWLPATFDSTERGTQAFQSISEKGLTVNHDLDSFAKGLSKDGIKMFADPHTIQELNKTGVSLMKTYLTAGIGGAIALTGLILFFKTIMSKSPDSNQDIRPFYRRMLTNRYVISALLMATGVGVILTSDKIVAAVS